MLSVLKQNLGIPEFPSLKKGFGFSTENTTAGADNSKSQDFKIKAHKAPDIPGNRGFAEAFLRLLSYKPERAWDIVNSSTEEQADFLLNNIKEDKVKLFFKYSMALKKIMNSKADELRKYETNKLVVDCSGLNLSASEIDFSDINRDLEDFSAEHYEKYLKLDLRGANLDRSIVTSFPAEVDLAGASMFGAEIYFQGTQNVNFDNASLVGASISGFPASISAQNTDLRYLDWYGWRHDHFSLDNFKGANVFGSDIRTSFSPGNEFISDPKADLGLAMKDLRAMSLNSNGSDTMTWDLEDQLITGAKIDSTTIFPALLANCGPEEIARILNGTENGKRILAESRHANNLGRRYLADPDVFRDGVPGS